MLGIEPGILEHLDAKRIDYCLIGGFALAARGYPRYTTDVDLLTTDPQVLDEDFWKGCVPSPELRRGDVYDPLLGVVRFATAMPVDIVVTGGHAARLAVSTATPTDDAPRVATTLALVLLKLEAGGKFDLDDAARLIEAHETIHDTGLRSEIEGHVSRLSTAGQDAWPKLVARLAP